jgi:hypothetical protein
MLFILIPIAWLAAVTFFVALCRSAARGDQITLTSSSEQTVHGLRRTPGSPPAPALPGMGA